MRVNPSRYASFLRESLILYFFFYYFFGLIERSWSFRAWFLSRFSLFFPPFQRVFCNGFSWPQSVSCRYVPKTPLIFLCVFFDARFFKIFFFRLNLVSKYSGDYCTTNEKCCQLLAWKPVVKNRILKPAGLLSVCSIF